MSKFDLNNNPIFSDSVESKIGVYFIIALGRRGPVVTPIPCVHHPSSTSELSK